MKFKRNWMCSCETE